MPQRMVEDGVHVLVTMIDRRNECISGAIRDCLLGGEGCELWSMGCGPTSLPGGVKLWILLGVASSLWIDRVIS